MKVKICGIKTTDEAKIMNEYLPDFIGFVFAKSKREISFENAKKIKETLNPKIKTVGVFVDKNINEILKYKSIIDFAQLHGDYNEEDIQSLKKEEIKVIKVIKVQKKEYNINTKADFVLFDTYSKKEAGGTNKTFDWNIKIKTNVPYFIAGGLNKENLPDMIEKLHPYGADISSGVETDGYKTKEKVSIIMNIIRGTKNE